MHERDKYYAVGAAGGEGAMGRGATKRGADALDEVHGEEEDEDEEDDGPDCARHEHPAPADRAAACCGRAARNSTPHM